MRTKKFKLKLLMKNKLIYLIFCISYSCLGQDFQWEAPIAPIQTNGYYSITLSPDITSRLNSNQGDIRLYNSQQLEVPFLSKGELPLDLNQVFVEYPILSKKTNNNKRTEIIILNESKKAITNLCLAIKNADAYKTIRLSGSDDQNEWFIIKSNYIFQGANNSVSTEEFKRLYFPLSNYKYFKIEINDRFCPPLNIIKAGYFDQEIEVGKYQNIPGVKFQIIDSSQVKKTYIKVLLSQKHYIDKLNFQVKSPENFRRNIELALWSSDTLNKKNNRNKLKTEAHFILDSNSPNNFSLHSIYTNEFYIIIYNHDDLPLKIKEINLSQLNKSLIAYLDQKEQYSLKFGSNNCNPPIYDLKHFESQIPAKLPIIHTKEIRFIGDHQMAKKSENKFAEQWLWFIIILVGIVLTYFSFKMIREIKNSNH
jgi:hypothetical protein